MKTSVNAETCIGCGLCVSICPEVFELGADMIAKVILDEIPDNLAASVQEAASACPVEAITVE